MPFELALKLSREDFDLLLWALATTASRARLEGNQERFCRLVQLANAINQDNPNWTPYEIPEESNVRPTG